MTSLPGSRLLRIPGLFCAVLCQSAQNFPVYKSMVKHTVDLQLMQQRRVGRALNLAARVEDQSGTGRCDLRGKKPGAGIALTMGIGFRAKRCFFKMVCPPQIRMQIRI